MPNFEPSVSDVHIDKFLSGISIAYIQDERNFVARQIAPTISVNHQTDVYLEYDRNAFFQDEAQIRAPGTESQGSGYAVSQGTYRCEEYAFHKDTPDEVFENADSVVEVDEANTIYVTQKLLLKNDMLLANEIFTTGVWTTDDTTSTDWDDYALSTPIQDVDITAKDAIHSITSFDPNTLVLGRQVWKQLKHHVDFLERIKYTQKGVITADLVAALMDVDRIVVAQTLRATNVEGATAAYAYNWGKNALLMYVNPAPSLMTPSAMYSFRWNKRGMASRFRRLRNEWAQFVRVEGMFNVDHKVVGADLGYFFSGIVS
jgi:hypothetical protein